MATSGLWIPLSASLLAAHVTTIGIYVNRHFEGWGRKATLRILRGLLLQCLRSELPMVVCRSEPVVWGWASGYW
jgi:hypothetical protein